MPITPAFKFHFCSIKQRHHRKTLKKSNTLSPLDTHCLRFVPLARNAFSGSSGRAAAVRAFVALAQTRRVQYSHSASDCSHAREVPAGTRIALCQPPVPAQFAAANNKSPVRSACRPPSVPALRSEELLGRRAAVCRIAEGGDPCPARKSFDMHLFLIARRSCPTGIPDPPRGNPAPCPRTTWGRR